MLCKKCDEEITYLNWSEQVVHYGTYDGLTGFESDGDSRDNGSTCITFLTPCCDEEVATCEEEARNYFKK